MSIIQVAFASVTVALILRDGGLKTPCRWPYRGGIYSELDADLTDSGSTPSTLALFQSAVQSANGTGCQGLILDIRNNLGGLDDMAAAMLGSFYAERTFYEYQNDYDYATRQY